MRDTALTHTSGSRSCVSVENPASIDARQLKMFSGSLAIAQFRATASSLMRTTHSMEVTVLGLVLSKERLIPKLSRTACEAAQRVPG